MKAGTRKKDDRGGAEYRMFIAPISDSMTGSTTTLVRLETTRSFASFAFAIAVSDAHTSSSLSLKVRGLETPRLHLPSFGPASFQRRYAALRGLVNVSIETLEGRAYTFSVRISPTDVQIVQPPSSALIQVMTGTTITEQPTRDTIKNP